MKYIMCLLSLLVLCLGCTVPEHWQASPEHANYIISKLPVSNEISQQHEVFARATHKVVADFSPDGEWWLTAYLVDFDVCCNGMLLLRDFYIEAYRPENQSEYVYVHVLSEYYLSNFHDIVPIERSQ